MVPAAPLAALAQAPIVRLASGLIGESDAVRATVSGLSTGRVYTVRFRVPASTTAASLGCASHAMIRVAGSRHPVHVGLAPHGVWCAGAAILSVALAGRGAVSSTSRLRVRAPEALGDGNVLGRVVIGPTCPVERVDDPCDPVARPEPVAIVAFDANGAEAARTVTLADGSFAFDLPPGSFTLHPDRSSTPFPSIADASVVVTAAATRATPQRVVVTGDTGIR